MIPMPSEAVATLGPMLTGVDAGNNTPHLRAFSALSTTCLHPNETRIGKQPPVSGGSRRFESLRLRATSHTLGFLFASYRARTVLP